MEFAFPEEDLAISRYNVMTCKTTISLMFEQKKMCSIQNKRFYYCIYFFSFHSSNAIDTKFDEAVGHIEDIIMGRYIPLTDVLNNLILEMFNAVRLNFLFSLPYF